MLPVEVPAVSTRVQYRLERILNLPGIAISASHDTDTEIFVEFRALVAPLAISVYRTLRRGSLTAGCPSSIVSKLSRPD